MAILKKKKKPATKTSFAFKQVKPKQNTLKKKGYLVKS